MSDTRTPIAPQPARVFTRGRLLVAAALLAGLFAMHGPTMADMTMTPASGSQHVAAAAMTVPDVATQAVHAMNTITAVAADAVGDRMPMPGPGSHDMLHPCLAVLTALAALALLAAALARAGTPVTALRLQRLAGAERRQRDRPPYRSVTELCISRT